MSDRELQLPSDEQRRRDRALIEALDGHEPVGERYARTGEIPVPSEREPTMRPDPHAGQVMDPTPVQLLSQPRRRIGRRIAQMAGLLVALGLAYLAVSYWQVWSTGRSDEARDGRRDRGDGRSAVRRSTLAAARGPARPRCRSLARGFGAARRRDGRQPAR